MWGSTIIETYKDVKISDKKSQCLAEVNNLIQPMVLATKFTYGQTCFDIVMHVGHDVTNQVTQNDSAKQLCMEERWNYWNIILHGRQGLSVCKQWREE